ncbi:DUF4169 family protein [Planktomarina sp.]|nr:DUF4169 family protein [Planktomarina sp.]
MSAPVNLNRFRKAKARAEKSTRAEVEESGSDTVQVSSHRDIKRARSEAREIFIEAVISVEATGRPRVARE